MTPASVKHFRKEPRQSHYIPITHLNSPTIFETQSGQVGTIIEVEGVPFDVANPDELNHYKQVWHQTLLLLNEDFGLYTHMLRQKMNVSLTGNFPDAFTTALDQKYHQRFKQQTAYKNRLYLTLLLKPMVVGTNTRKFGQLFTSITARTPLLTAREAYRSRAIKKLEVMADQVMTLLKVFKPRCLGTQDEPLGYSEILHFFSQQLNGLQPLYLKAANEYQEALLTNQLRDSTTLQARYPHGHIGQFLAASRLFFGHTIELRQATHSRYAKILSIKSYGTETTPTIFDRLLEIDSELMSTHSYFPTAAHQAQKKIVRKAIQLDNANDPAESQIVALHTLRDDLASEHIKTGQHHHSVMVLAESLEALEHPVREAVKVLVDAGFTPVLEDANLEGAYFSQFAGNQDLIARDCLITSENMADFFPLHNYQTGYRDHNHLGAAVTLWETPSRTPVFFNYHRQGSGHPEDYTPGHATIIGGNGSGKTTLMTFTDAQLGRYGGRSFLFDRDRGMELYVRACGGHYLILHPDYPQDCQMNPFSLDDTAANRSFLTDWLCQLVKRDQESSVSSPIRQTLKQCVDYVYQHLSPPERCLREAVKYLGIDFSHHAELAEWLASQAGSYAYLFDHQHDQLEVDGHKLGIDLTYLMTQPDKVLTVVMMYLFHRIEASLQTGGERVSVFIDEGWQVLQNPYWRTKLTKWLPTLRKLNCHLVLATQSPASVVNSPLCSVFLDNCACHIFACNEKANWKEYQQFNLSEYEFHFLKETPVTKRLLLYKQDQVTCVCRLNLSGMEKELAILAGNRNTVALGQQARQQAGEEPEHWLPVFYQLNHEASAHAN